MKSLTWVISALSVACTTPAYAEWTLQHHEDTLCITETLFAAFPVDKSLPERQRKLALQRIFDHAEKFPNSLASYRFRYDTKEEALTDFREFANAIKLSDSQRKMGEYSIWNCFSLPPL